MNRTAVGLDVPSRPLSTLCPADHLPPWPPCATGKGHNKSVDWWSIGILLYEMLCGMPPFRAKSRNALQTQITSGKVKYPKFLSSEAQNLLKVCVCGGGAWGPAGTARPDGARAWLPRALLADVHDVAHVCALYMLEIR